MIPLNLSTLSAEDASSLEQIFGAAAEKFAVARDEAHDRLRMALPGSVWAMAADHEMRRAEQHFAQAIALSNRAHLQTAIADRERCQAIRVIQSLAAAALPIRGDVGRAA